MLKAIIIDDEQDALDILLDEIKKNCSEIKVIDTCPSGIEGIKSIRKHKPDVIFLDIDMPGMSGFEMLEVIGNIDFGIIFTTAYNQYAVRAFDISAIHYLLKPIDNTHLVEAVKRLIERRQTAQNFQQDYDVLSHNRNPENLHKKIVFSTQSSYEFINSEDIIYCEADGNYTDVYLTNNEKRTYSRPLKSIQKLLEDYHFFRIHHSYLANLDHITKFIKTDGDRVQMTNDKKLPVSRHYKKGLLDRLT